jgi:hypothetical protein
LNATSSIDPTAGSQRSFATVSALTFFANTAFQRAS